MPNQQVNALVTIRLGIILRKVFDIFQVSVVLWVKNRAPEILCYDRNCDTLDKWACVPSVQCAQEEFALFLVLEETAKASSSGETDVNLLVT